MSFNKIVLIGAGRVATQLARILVEKQKTILQVFSRSDESAQQLSSISGAEPVTKISLITLNADLYIISVVDDAIETIAKQLTLENKLVVHTSGSVQMKTLSTASSKFGVFYPLQTFDKKKNISFSEIPICIEGSDKQVESDLITLGKELSKDVRIISSEQRLYIHIAAVFASNFSNFMYLIGAEILEYADVDFNILAPLIKETADKITKNHPYLSQTGPALRGDFKTMQKHLDMLEGHPEKKDIYKNISKFITSYFSQQKNK